MNPQELEATLSMARAELVKSFGKPIDDPSGLIKANTFSQSGSATSGLTYYDLELGAKLVYPVLTPLRNTTPRVSGKGGIQAAWRAITAINTAGLRIGLGEGNRNAFQAVATKDYTAAYKAIGLDSATTFEAQYAAQGFDDARAKATLATLQGVMLGEELLIVGGNTSVALGTTPTPSATPGTSGGALADATYSVICVALAFDAMVNGSVSGGIQGAITRTNADSSSDSFGGGAARKSAAGSATVSGGSGAGKVSATVTAVPGACGYAWFWGLSGSEVLGAITNINSVVITAAAAGTQTAASLGTGDNSQNALAFDGLLSIALASNSGAYINTLATGTAGVGTTLTATGEGGVVEIDNMLKDRWDNYRLSFDELLVSSQEQTNISKKMLTGNSTSAQRFVFTGDPANLAGGGVMVASYRNKYSMAGAKEIPIKLHPNMPAGTILGLTRRLPYPQSNIDNVFQIRTRQEYYSFDWPARSRKYEHGVYADEVLQHYFPPAIGIINNIANG